MDNKLENIKNKTISGVIWSFAERILAQIISFVVSVILARLLLPEQYGIIAIVTVIISICNVFVTTGFATSLIQKKEADDVDFSSVFYFGIVFAIFVYLILFLAAPFIASFYKYELLTPVIRVMGISLLISSVKSVQHSYISRKMQFKKFFWSTFWGTLTSAVVGIIMAYFGLGVWALVAQYLVNSFMDTVILWITVEWRPKFVFSITRLKVLLSFGWKVLASNLLYTVYDNLRTLIIGKVYTSDNLAFYNKGKQFPNLFITNINSSLSSAMLPAMSKMQDDKELIRNYIRRFIRTGSYILMPMMFMLAMVSDSLVRILLTDKWIECVPIIKLMCINYALLPLQTANTQAVLAYGRSDISLKTEILKRATNIIIILITFRISIMALILGEVASGFLCLIINTMVSKKLFNYGTLSQVRDMAPYIALSAAMSVIVFLVSRIPMTLLLQLIVQVLVGIISYICISKLFKVESYNYIVNTIKSIIKNRSNK